MRLNEGDRRALRKLVGLLMGSSDPVVLAVSSHDVGQYVKYHQPGKK